MYTNNLEFFIKKQRMDSLINNFNKKQSNKEEYLSNDNLLKIMLKYCSIYEILNLSLVSKKFNSITHNFDYLFKNIINKLFFSNYENYK